MSNRRRLARERLEIFLVHLLLSYRWLILIIGLFLLMYAITVMIVYPLAGALILLLAIYLLSLSNSFKIVLYTARLGAWVGTLWNCDE
jgi:hypothetical protein